MMKIAALYTCFNRKAKTIASIYSLYDALEKYNMKYGDSCIKLEIFVTDDGCTDGTADAIKTNFPKQAIHILRATGNLFWAKGMVYAWSEARKRHVEWDYYLLLNDDTIINSDALEILLQTDKYCRINYQQQGLYSGLTCSSYDANVITYGGDIISKNFNGRHIRVGKSSHPQMVDMTNANILLVPKSVVDRIGIFYDGYQHRSADNDYTLLAKRKKIPVLVTADVCGICDNDHGIPSVKKEKIIAMTLKERKAYFNHPLYSTRDYLIFIRRNMPLRYPLSWIFRMMLVYYPKLYYRINKSRKII